MILVSTESKNEVVCLNEDLEMKTPWVPLKVAFNRTKTLESWVKSPAKVLAKTN